MNETTQKPARDKVSVNRILILLFPTIIGVYGVYQAIGQVLLPAQIVSIDPTNKVHDTAMISFVNSLVGTIILPVGAAISDRTRSRFGRRTPWLIISALGTALTCIGMGFMTGIASLVVMAGLVWLFANWFQGVIYAVIPDRIPEDKRGVASSVTGLGVPVGILVFVNLASRTGQHWGYLLVGLFLLVAAVAFCIFAPEPSSLENLPQEPKEKKRKTFNFKEIGHFFSAFLHWDFTMAFISRFTFYFAAFAISSFTFYVLTDYIGTKNIPGQNPTTAVATISSIQTVAQIIAIIIFGKLADMLDRRKLVVAMSSIVYMVSFIVPLVMPNWIGMVIYAIINGAAGGVYFSVDIAVMSLVLPSKADEGRDLGILAVATSVPAALSPLIGSMLISATGTYAAVFVFGILTSFLGGVFTMLIRSVR